MHLYLLHSTKLTVVPATCDSHAYPAFAGEVWDAGKFFGTFPYPYMNGMLHLGHAFSLSKVCWDYLLSNPSWNCEHH